MDDLDPRHGTYAGAAAHRTEGEPPCFPCRVAHANYLSDVNRMRAYGQWNPWADAEPARQHVRALMADGTSIRRIANAADVSVTRVSYLLYGRGGKNPPTKIRPDFAAALLAVAPDPGMIPIYRVSRRLAALIALGYPQPQLAELLGFTQARVWEFLNHGQAFVTATTFEKISGLYDELSMKLPPTNTRVEKYRVSRSKNTAARNGYLPPLAWTDIDDPNEQPADWQYRPTDRADQLREFAEMGAGITEVCRRLKVGRDALEKWCARNGMSDAYRRLAAREAIGENQHMRDGAA